MSLESIGPLSPAGRRPRWWSRCCWMKALSRPAASDSPSFLLGPFLRFPRKASSHAASSSSSVDGRRQVSSERGSRWSVVILDPAKQRICARRRARTRTTGAATRRLLSWCDSGKSPVFWTIPAHVVQSYRARRCVFCCVSVLTSCGVFFFFF